MQIILKHSKTKNIATAAWRAFVLVEGTYSAIRAASTISVHMHPHSPEDSKTFRGTLSTIGIAMKFSPKEKVSQAAGYKSCFTSPNSSIL
jgi:hypothetical protein